jgi:Fungal trichothecene efflux pump (TRI12)
MIGFYINLPAGAATTVLLIFFFKPMERDASTVPFLQKLKYLDIPGFLLFMPSVAMLLLAIQWGGTTYPWNSATIIGLLCGFVAMILIFIWWQWCQQEEASIPPRVFLNRSVMTASLVSFLLFGGMQLRSYYLPIWFQVTKAVSPTDSGVDFLPSALSTMLGTLVAGGLGEAYMSFVYTLLLANASRYATWLLQSVAICRCSFNEHRSWTFVDSYCRFRNW